MPDRLSEEKRHKIIQRMIIEGNVAKIAKDEDISETTVRNIWSETKAGAFPEYTSFIPTVEATRRLSEDLKKAGVTVAQAATGLTIFTALRDLGVEPVRLPSIVKMLKNVAGDKPSAEFGKAVEELAKLQAETGLDFNQLEALIITKRSELEDHQTKVKAAREELNSLQGKITEAKEDLDRTLKQKNVTLEDLKQYLETRRAILDAGLSFADLNTLAAFIKTAASQGFLQSSKELALLESETGMGFKTIVQEYTKTREGVDKLGIEKVRLTNDVNALVQRLADLTKQEAEKLIQSGMTKEKIERIKSTIDRLKEGGVNLE